MVFLVISISMLPVYFCADEVTISTQIIQSTTRLPIDLYDIGYDGTWERFCDPNEIIEDFPGYPDHDLKRIRILICTLRKDGKVDRKSVPAFAAYKLCHMIRPVTDYFFEKLSEKFSDHDDEKKGEMLATDIKNDTNCYNETMKVFTEKCMGPKHICIRMFKDLIGHACLMSWLTTEGMATSINEICDGKWISDKIDWDSIFLSIKYFE